MPAQFAPGDRKILEWLDRVAVATPTQLHFLVGERSRYVIGRRLRRLQELGKIKSTFQPDKRFAEYAWFTGEERGQSNIPHDLVITDLVCALVKLEREAKITELQFTRKHEDLYDRFGSEPDDKINPDLFFSFKVNDLFPCFFVEVENSGNHHYVAGKSARIRKMEAFARYPNFEKKFGGDDFFVLTLLPSDEERDNFIAKLTDYLATRKFWAGSYAAINRLSEKTLKTPKDVAVSLLDCVDAC